MAVAALATPDSQEGKPVAVQMKTKTYTSAGGPVNLSTIYGFTRPHTWVKSVTLRAGRFNADDAYWSDSDLEAGGYLGPGEATTVDFGEGQAFAENFYLQVSAGDKVYISLDVNRYYYDTI